MSAAVYRAGLEADRTRFARHADSAVDRVVARIDRHLLLLRSAAALFDAHGGAVDGTHFRSFVASLHNAGAIEGVQGIGFARSVPADAVLPVEQEIAAIYGIERPVWPATRESRRTIIVMLEPQDARNRAALGYDMYHEASRRDAMSAAIATGEPAATAPVELVQEITSDKQAGILVYLPVLGKGVLAPDGGTDPVAGFVYAPFRIGDLFSSALDREPLLPVETLAVDRDAPEAGAIHRSPGWSEAEGAAHGETRIIPVAGREWVVRFAPAPEFQSGSAIRTAGALAVISLMLALALALSARAQFNALEAARKLADVSHKSAQDKDLLLQEMKHRIKNAIARILAIARHTAAGSTDLDAFSSAFSARLMAMSAAQDIVTRSPSGTVDLAALLEAELRQIAGEGQGELTLAGPPVTLGGRAAQALGLVFHELSTNALKYGSLSGDGAELSVAWRVEKSLAGSELVIEWREPGAPAGDGGSRAGFGTRLIDANIRGEMAGSVQRAQIGGARVTTIRLPLASLQ